MKNWLTAPRRSCVLLIVLTIVACPAYAWAQAEHQHGEAVPERLGRVDFETSCAPAVQADFNRAVALLHSFAFRKAIEGFEGVLERDPSCRIALWGIALSTWSNPFAGIKGPQILEQGSQVVRRASGLSGGTPRERDYMDAVSELYRDYQTRDHPTRIAAYDSAMQRLSAANPGDREARIFAALASVQTAAPTDKTYAKQLAAGAILEELFAKYPDHPGLAHYIIHAYDVPALAPRALDAARRYAAIAPSAPHALHMPSHTFTRLGYWQESIQSNIASAASAAAESATAEQLHAMDYMAYAYLQVGRDDEVRALIDQVGVLQEHLKSPAAGGSAAPVSVGTYATAAIPARYALERADWAGATALTVATGATPQSEAVTEFARAVGAARSGHPDAASSSLDRLAAIRDALRTSGDAYWSGQSEIQRQGASAWVAWARGDKDEGLRLAAAAADAEDATEKSAATPGPLMPARELLADMQFEAGRFADAQKSYEAVLTKEPHRFRAEYGAGVAAERAGDQSGANAHYRALLNQCAPVTGSPRDALRQAQRALDSR